MLGVGDDPFAMVDRRQLLERLLVSLAHPGVDGVLGSPDVLEELALLGALDGKLAFGTMNRGGIMGARWELDDRMTAYDAEGIAHGGLDGGKVLLRIADDDAGTAPTLEACARAVSALARRGLPIMVEPLPYHVTEDGTAKLLDDDDKLLRAVAVAAAIGSTERPHLAQGARGPGRGPHAVRHDAAGADPRRRARPGPGGHVRVVGAGDGRCPTCGVWSSAGRCCTRRTATSPRPSRGRPASCDPERAMAERSLHRPDGTLASGSDPVALTPEQAGWTYSGLRVLRLRRGRAERARRPGPTRWPSCRCRSPTWWSRPTGSASSWTGGRACSRG